MTDGERTVTMHMRRTMEADEHYIDYIEGWRVIQLSSADAGTRWHLRLIPELQRRGTCMLLVITVELPSAVDRFNTTNVDEHASAQQ